MHSMADVFWWLQMSCCVTTCTAYVSKDLFDHLFNRPAHCFLERQTQHHVTELCFAAFIATVPRIAATADTR